MAKMDEDVAVLVENIAEVYDVIAFPTEQYDDTGFTAKHHITQQLVAISLTTKGGDVDAYIGAILANKREQEHLKCGFPDWWFTSVLISNLDGKFKDFAQRQALKKALPNFEEVAAELREVNRMTKRDNEVTAYRAQVQQGQSAFKAAQKKKQEEAKQKQKNSGTQTDGQKSGGGKKAKLTCTMHGEGNHDDSTCYKQHEELRPANWKPKHKRSNKKKDDDDDVDLTKPSAKYTYTCAMMTSTRLSLQPTIEDEDEDSVSISSRGWRAHQAAKAKIKHSNSSEGVESYFKQCWIVDSGTTYPMTRSKIDFIEFTPLKVSISVSTANGYHMTATGTGSVLMECELPDGSIVATTISEVLYVPELSIGLLSVQKLAAKGADVRFKDDYCRIDDATGTQVLHGVLRHGQYELQLLRSSEQVIARVAKYNEDTVQVWYRRTGHLNLDDLKRLPQMVDGINLQRAIKHPHVCGSCQKGKHTRKPSRRPQEDVTEPLDCIDSDVIGPISPESAGGKRYAVIFADRATGLSWGNLMRKESEVYTIFSEEFQPTVENLFERKIKRWRTDWGTEVDNKRTKAFSKKRGIRWEPSTPYAKEQNGVAERHNRIIIEKLRSILHDAGLSLFLWGDIFYTSIYLKNPSPSARLKRRGIFKTPYEVGYKKKPNLGHLRIIGCDAWHHVPKETPSFKKLDQKAVKCRLLGYEGTYQYRLWNPTFRRVILSRDVTFDEASMLGTPTTDCQWDDDIYGVGSLAEGAPHEEDSSDEGYHSAPSEGNDDDWDDIQITPPRCGARS